MQEKTPPSKNVCFAKAILLGMEQLCTDLNMDKSYRSHNTPKSLWTNKAIELSTCLVLRVDECIMWKKIATAADYFEGNIYIFDMIHMKPDQFSLSLDISLCKACIFSTRGT